MRSLFGGFAIFLTLLVTLLPGRNARAYESLATCGAEGAPGPDLGWLEELSRAMQTSISGSGSTPSAKTDPRPEKKPEIKSDPVAETKPSPSPEPEEPRFGATDEPPSGVHDLNDDPPARRLSALRQYSRVQAERCRKKHGRCPRDETKTCAGGICGGRTHSKYLCYQAVKDVLVDMGYASAAWDEEAAVNAHRRGTLLKLGFRNVLKEGYNSKNAPLGAVLVYSGGRFRCRDEKNKKMQCGHTEIKLSSTEYCSDYCKRSPIDHYAVRKLVGIYVKE